MKLQVPVPCKIIGKDSRLGLGWGTTDWERERLFGAFPQEFREQQYIDGVVFRAEFDQKFRNQNIATIGQA